MIERIYIPTIKRPDRQITFNHLPESLQEKVILVIDPAERELYNQKVELLEIPKKFVGSWTQLAETRKFIHIHAGTTKYAMIDDDIVIGKRNSKYTTGVSDMNTSSRSATPNEILKLFEMANQWLDHNDIGIVGVSDPMFPPAKKVYSDTKGVFSCLFLDGKKISKIVHELDTPIRIAEDVLFLFECLSRGINTRVSNQYLYRNKSLTGTLDGTRPIWEDIWKEMPKDYFQTDEHYDALKFIQSRFPDALTIFEEDGKMKNTKHWKKIYKPNVATLEDFLV